MKMKKLIMVIIVFMFSFTLYSQDYNINEELWNLTKIEYQYEDYSDPGKIEYYDKRIADVLKKYEYVICNKDEYDIAVEQDWFENSFRPALDNAIQSRNIFTEKKYEKLNKEEHEETN